MNQSQASAAARRIPFNPDVPLPTNVQAGLKAVVAKQLRRIDWARDGLNVARRELLRRQGGVQP